MVYIRDCAVHRANQEVEQRGAQESVHHDRNRITEENRHDKANHITGAEKPHKAWSYRFWERPQREGIVLHLDRLKETLGKKILLIW